MVDASFSPDIFARLTRCLRYWDAMGFRFVSLPWMTPTRYIEATKPAFVVGKDVVTAHGTLVASGEQSFLMMEDQGLLPEGGRFVGWTPCFRPEPVFDAQHHFYFLKAELYQRVDSLQSAREALGLMVDGAQRWMQQEMCDAGVGKSLRLEDMGPDQTDILMGQFELGSYGVRRFANQLYVYGTACAEPRFTEAIGANSSNL